jgi:hypothetical protein
MLLSLVVRNISDRGTPEALIPSPTSFSLSKSMSWCAKTGLDDTFQALTIPSGRVDVPVAIIECDLDGTFDIAWLGLPSSYGDRTEEDQLGPFYSHDPASIHQPWT